jgi:hypothetical protein
MKLNSNVGNTVGDEDIPISAGHVLNFTTDPKYAKACSSENVYVDYANITKVIEPGKIIFVDDGIQAFEVLEIVDEKTVKAKARNAGFISSRKGVNLPNTDVDLPALSEKDKNDLRVRDSCLLCCHSKPRWTFETPISRTTPEETDDKKRHQWALTYPSLASKTGWT